MSHLHSFVAPRIRLRKLCEEHGTERLSLPLIACGLDGLKVKFILSYALSLSYTHTSVVRVTNSVSLFKKTKHLGLFAIPCFHWLLSNVHTYINVGSGQG